MSINKIKNKFCTLPFALFLLTFTIIHQPSTIAEVRYVSHTGNNIPPYLTWEDAADSIQAAINVCSPGDTVIVANGVYYENLVIDSSLTLIGSSMDSTVIDGRGLGDYTIIYNVSGSVENFNIYGRGESILTSRVIRSNSQFAVVEVKNNKISEAGVGISMVGGDVIADNLYLINLTRGFNLFGDNNNFISNCIVILDNSNSIGISIGFAPNINHFITNNIILFTGTNSLEPGISISAPNKVYIYNNIISGFRRNISLDVPQDTTFIINEILLYSSSRSISTENDYVVINNNVHGNNTNIAIMGFPPYVDLDYNLFWNNQNDLYGLTYGDSDQVADPMFIKDTLPNLLLEFDYHLEDFSPGIDKGDPDILDVNGTRSDIGFYGGPLGTSYKYIDLAPKPPRNISAVQDTNSIFLKWNRNTEADTSYYNVYRDTVTNFTIDSTKLIASPIDTFFIQLPPYNSGQYVYKVTCMDNQGNESEPSEEIVIKPVSVNEYPHIISDYLLYQNYPNPFNPSTTIGYKLKERGYVKLMVYDIKGELISVLVNIEQEAGYYEAEFGRVLSSEHGVVRQLASGIYLYRIEVIGEGNIPVYSDMKKMVLIK